MSRPKIAFVDARMPVHWAKGDCRLLLGDCLALTREGNRALPNPLDRAILHIQCRLRLTRG